ncbi:STAS domain-containing protein [Nocardia sp. NPDC057668]|uniref:STAS domain-containing protein n=1 Tax=Nocardia sp. NPDC057668 TaxID=3346202 RepID=UPI00366C6A19
MPAQRPASHTTDTASRHVHAIIRIEGELDALVLPEFRQTLTTALRAGVAIVVLDLRNTRFLSIGNAAVLICAATEAVANGVDLRMVVGRREVDRVLRLSGARSLLNSYHSLSAALEV